MKKKICPFCKKRPIVRKITCGNPMCQYKCKLKMMTKYYDEFYRKKKNPILRKHAFTFSS